MIAGEIWSAVSFSTLAEIPSGPVALCCLRFLRSFSTPAVVIRMSSISGYWLGPAPAVLNHHQCQILMKTAC